MTRVTVWEESRHIARREEIMRARGERAVRGDAMSQVERSSTPDLADSMDMSEQTYHRRHAIGRGVTEETADVLDSTPSTSSRSLPNNQEQLNYLANVRDPEAQTEIRSLFTLVWGVSTLHTLRGRSA